MAKLNYVEPKLKQIEVITRRVLCGSDDFPNGIRDLNWGNGLGDDDFNDL